MSSTATSLPSFLQQQAYRWKLDRARAKSLGSDIAWRHIDLHSAQREIYDHPARFKIIACGRRFGKTQEAIQVLGESTLKTGSPHAYIAPTYKALKDVWRMFKIALADYTTDKNEQEMRLELVGGGVIDFWSAQSVDTVRGRKYAGMVVDEAAWNKDLDYAWNFVLRPTLTDFRGWAWFISTPKGRDFFWQLWVRGQDESATDWKSWQFPTTANPYIDPAEIEEMRYLIPERTFQQEYLAEFLDDGGAVFRNLKACTTADKDAQPNRGEWYTFGVDWGKSEDFTVIAVMNHAGTLVALDRFNQISWSFQRGRLMALAEKWQPRTIWAELNSIGDPNVEALQMEGLPVQGFQTTAQSKGPLIESLALAFEQEQVSIFEDPVLLGELQAYTMDRLPSGRFRYSAPEGMHDDTVIALALAWHGTQQKPITASVSRWA